MRHNLFQGRNMLRHNLLQEGILVLFWLGIWEIFRYVLNTLKLNHHQRVIFYIFITVGASIGYFYSWTTPKQILESEEAFI